MEKDIIAVVRESSVEHDVGSTPTYGAEVVSEHDTIEEAERNARELQIKKGFEHPGSHEDTVEWQTFSARRLELVRTLTTAVLSKTVIHTYVDGGGTEFTRTTATKENLTI